MARVIHKHELTLGMNQFRLEDLAHVIKVGEQDGKLFLWEEHQTHSLSRNQRFRHFAVIPTGREFHFEGQNYHHVETVIMSDSGLVWHVYEVKD